MFLRRLFSSGISRTRNVAIIAHVDHGKTTLVDRLLDAAGLNGTKTERLMDSSSLEKERGITILSKCTSIRTENMNINIVDTPGHADFGGEVERALSLVNGVILVIDASEGPMAQTKSVLSKALKLNLPPIIVQNKVDRLSARCKDVDAEIMELFFSLNAPDHLLNYPTFYASAKEGWAFNEAEYKLCTENLKKASEGNMKCILNAIMSYIPPPVSRDRSSFSLLVNCLEHDSFMGRCAFGKVESGTLKVGDSIYAVDPNSTLIEKGRATKIFIRRGLEIVEISEAKCGDIVTISGLEKVQLNHTMSSEEKGEPLPPLHFDPPTMAMVFTVNKSPLSGIEGKSLTKVKLEERLRSECEKNLSLQMDKVEGCDESFKLSGRGEMQLGVLIETIRREGYELTVSPPQVLYKTDTNGEKLEPIEEITVDSDDEFCGLIIEKLSKRKAELVKMVEIGEGRSRLTFNGPTRGLIGFSSELKNDSKGTAVINHCFHEYAPFKGEVSSSRKGCMTSMASGTSTAYALADLESRGELFISPGESIYPGMVIGECARQQNLEVNPCRQKQVTNVRSTVREEFSRLRAPKTMTLEEMISYMSEDEVLDITPKSLRLRKLKRR